jgi:Kef-type K+ transport system membrane component KefB
MRAAVWALVLGAPGAAWAADGSDHARFGPTLFAVALLFAAAKAGGLLAERARQPAVLGELLVGVALGNLWPMLLGGEGIAFVRADSTLSFLAQVGVLILLFDVGLEADLRAFARVGGASLLVASIGVVVPMALGWAAAAWLLPESPTIAHVFVGATLSATSVGITARVLKDLSVTQTREAQIILGAAVMDDILGLVVLAVVSGIATAGAAGLSALTVVGILGRAVLFLGAAALAGHFFSSRIIRIAARSKRPETIVVVGLTLCFSLAYAAELIGLADIIGAFAAGILLDPYGQGVRPRQETATLAELLHPISALFVPLFFVLMGIQVHVRSVGTPSALAFAALLTLVALAGKAACALGVGQGTNRLAIAIGMIPRGEVGLIFAGIGSALVVDGQPLLPQSLFSAIVVMVLVTTLVTPIGLRWAFARRTAGGRA